VDIAPIEHAAGEYILCREGWRRGSSQINLGGLVFFLAFTDVRVPMGWTLTMFGIDWTSRLCDYVYVCVYIRWIWYSSSGISTWMAQHCEAPATDRGIVKHRQSFSFRQFASYVSCLFTRRLCYRKDDCAMRRQK